VSAVNVVYDVLTQGDGTRCAQLEVLLFGGDDPWPEAAFLRAVGAPHLRYVAARVNDHLPLYLRRPDAKTLAERAR